MPRPWKETALPIVHNNQEGNERPARAGCFPAESNYPAGNFTSLLPARPRR